MAYPNKRLRKENDARPRFDDFQWEILQKLNNGGQINVTIREFTMETAYRKLRNLEVDVEISNEDYEKYLLISETTGVDAETLIHNKIIDSHDQDDSELPVKWEVRKKSGMRD